MSSASTATETNATFTPDAQRAGASAAVLTRGRHYVVASADAAAATATVRRTAGYTGHELLKSGTQKSSRTTSSSNAYACR